MAVTLNASTTAGLVTSADTSGNLDLQAGGVTKIAVTSAGVAVTGLAKASLPTGSVLQVVQGTSSTRVDTTSTSFVTAGLTASITPTSATSKIFILVNIATYNANTGGNYGAVTIFRGTVAGTNLGSAGVGFGIVQGPTTAALASIACLHYLDSPATTSATTYTVGINTSSAASTMSVNVTNPLSTITLMEIAA